MPKNAKVDVIVYGGKVVTASGVSQAAIAINGERIAAVRDPDALPQGVATLKLRGNPGRGRIFACLVLCLQLFDSYLRLSQQPLKLSRIVSPVS